MFKISYGTIVRQLFRQNGARASSPFTQEKKKKNPGPYNCKATFQTKWNTRFQPVHPKIKKNKKTQVLIKKPRRLSTKKKKKKKQTKKGKKKTLKPKPFFPDQDSDSL